MFRSPLLLLIGLLLSTPAVAQDSAPDVTISASLRRLSDSEGQLTINAEIRPGLHIYAQTQPKPFLATRLQITESPDAQLAGPFVPSRQPLKHQHEQLPVELHEHEGQISWTAPVTFTEGTDSITVDGTVFAQACEQGRCFAPHTYEFSATLSSASAADSTTATSVPQKAAPSSPASDAVNATFDLSQIQVKAESKQSVWVILPLSMLAGFLLNFMPCVLPVVGLKVLSFVQQANSNRRRILLMNLAYTAGLMSVMLTLATLAGFAGLGWGEQFSSTGFTVTLSALVFAFGLSFLGVWEIPLPGFVSTAEGKSAQEGYAGAFSKGILSTLLATPCSGPFLGAALAWAVSQPVYLTYAVFAAVGLGMASPYLLIAVFPSAIRFLPKPGNWMITFKQVMGFIMLGTVVYLLSFMPIASVVPTTLLLLGLGVAVWLAGQTPGNAPRSQLIRSWATAGLLVCVTGVVSFGWLQNIMQARFERAAQRLVGATASTSVAESAHSEINWQPWSAERMQAAITEGRTVFVDFTADWCLTCQANEAAAIETPEFAESLRQHHVVAFRADKTAANPQADELLRRLGNSAASIPFYAVFPADHPQSPTTLDGIFTSPDAFVSAIETAAAGNEMAGNPMMPRH